TALRATAPVAIHVTDSGVRAELRPGARGTVVVATPRIAGWRCEGRPAGSYGGLLAVRPAAGQTSVNCTFRPPGLRAGLGVGAGALVLLTAGAALACRRNRSSAVEPPERRTRSSAVEPLEPTESTDSS
ncbi:MAG TPA: hypothetical protein VIU94_11595, partial [Streptomyces sp.]